MSKIRLKQLAGFVYLRGHANLRLLWRNQASSKICNRLSMPWRSKADLPSLLQRKKEEFGIIQKTPACRSQSTSGVKASLWHQPEALGRLVRRPEFDVRYLRSETRLGRWSPTVCRSLSQERSDPRSYLWPMQPSARYDARRSRAFAGGSLLPRGRR